MFLFGALANEFIVKMMQQESSAIVYRTALAVPFVGDFFADPRSAKWIQRPFVGVMHKLLHDYNGDEDLYEEWRHVFKRSINGKLHSTDGMPSMVVTPGLYIAWHRYGQIHRDSDKPAIVNVVWDTQEWYQHGQRHRDGDLPALIKGVGKEQEWYRHGQHHRDGGKPAVVSTEYGDRQEWWVDGRRHRDGGLPAVVRANGTNGWYLRGVFQRDDDPGAIFMAGMEADLV